MKLIALSLLVVVAAAAPLRAQDSETDGLKKEVAKLKTDQEVLLKQMEVQLAQIKELNEKLGKSREEASRSTRNFQLLERTHADGVLLTRQAQGPATAKVTAVALEIGLVVLSRGSEHGIREGDEFTLVRGAYFVAKVVVDRTDRQWSAARIVQKKLDPVVGDEASAAVPLPAPTAKPFAEGEKAGSEADQRYRRAEAYVNKGDRAAALRECQKALEADPGHLPARTLLTQLQAFAPPVPAPRAGEDLQTLRQELDEVRRQVRQLSDCLVPSWQGAGVAVEAASEELCAHLRIPRGLLVRRVRGGSTAEKAGLRANDILPHLQEPQLLELLDAGKSIDLIRQGQGMKLPGTKSR
jgi:hypothetical protein